MKVVTFSDRPDITDTPIYRSCSQQGLELVHLGAGVHWFANTVKLCLLHQWLQHEPEDELILVCDAYDVHIQSDEKVILGTFAQFNTDILFSAEANFYFRDLDLHYYYWKYYPRQTTPYDYLNSGSYMGSARHLKQLLQDISNAYQIDWNNEAQLKHIRSDQYLLSRFYVDVSCKFTSTAYSIALDHQQKLFGCSAGRTSTLPWPLSSKIHSFLFYQYERKILKTFGLSHQQTYFRDLIFVNSKIHNTLTESDPAVVHFPRTISNFNTVLQSLQTGKSKVSMHWLLAILPSTIAYFQSLIVLLVIRFYNKKKASQEEIFRYSPQKNIFFNNETEKIISHLKKNQPSAFAHFNDGELTFIDNYIKGSKTTSWYGRKQHQYDSTLGAYLTETIQSDLPNFLIGIPCSQCHPEHHQLAKALVSGQTTQAMALHHNLGYIPQLLGSLKGRPLHFVINEYQKLLVLEKLGLVTSSYNVTHVPYRNSYIQYKNLESRTFEKDTVVIMTCGMLAKILCPVWLKNNPTCTFLALGSVLDDLIQVDKIKFRLYPKQFPFTRNIYKYRSFLFGYKKECPECWVR